MIARCALAVLLALVLAAPAAAADWVTYQGDPGRSGTVDDPALRPPFARRWTAPVPIGTSQYYAPPLVADGRVFVGIRNGRNGTKVVAYDAASGAKLWERETVQGYGFGELAYESGRVVVLDDPGLMTGLAADTGAVQWQVNASADRLSLITPGGGNGLVYTGYGQSTSLVEAWDVTSGALRWKFQFNAEGVGAVAVSGSRVFADTYCGAMYALDAMSGAVAWQVPCMSGPHGGRMTQVRGDRVYGRGGDTLVRSAGNGQQLGTFTGGMGGGAFGNRILFSPIGVESKTLEARAVDDQHVLWTFSNGDRLGAPLALGDDAVLVPNRDGLDALDGATGRPLWHDPTVVAGMGAGAGLLFVEHGSELIAYEHVAPTAGPQAPAPIARTPVIAAARSIARGRLARSGLAVSVRGAAPGAVVRVSLRRGRRLLAKARGHASTQGRVTLRLRARVPRRAARLRLAVAVGTTKVVRSVVVRR